MSLSIPACDPKLLERFLSEDISHDEEDSLQEHLDQCTNCRQFLEQSAADEGTWSDVAEFLPDTADDSNSLSSLHDLPGRERKESQTASVASVLEILGPTDDPEMLGRLGPYEVSGVVGIGGMGVVLKGHDRSLDRIVAIKVMAPHLASSGAARLRFAREARAAAAVLHPNVMSIHSVSNNAALPYLVMPYMRGSSLQKRIDDHGPLPTVEVLRIGAQIASGLAAAHAQGLVHRDIKPANMMLTDGLEQVAITDFGLARAADDATMTRSGVIAGTPQYMSPEQARGEAIDARSDLFSLGSLLYAMCTGHSPFRAETSFGVLQRINSDHPRDIREINSDIAPWLVRLIERLLEKSPSARFQSAADVERLLSECLAHFEQPQNNPLPDSLKQPVTHSRPLIALGVVGILALLFFAVYLSGPDSISGGWLQESSQPLEDEPEGNAEVGVEVVLPLRIETEQSTPDLELGAKTTGETKPADIPTVDSVWEDGVQELLGSVIEDLDQLEAELALETPGN